MLDKAKACPPTIVFMDIEDAVAPIAKPDARKNICGSAERGVGSPGAHRARERLDPPWTYADVVEVVEGGGRTSTVIMLPKVQTPNRSSPWTCC